ncbi:hypothetical protein [Rheinheimera hassiensis]|uniref:hypothetical protein n=1 Tax=Rheinheimera hassiensis TaxID=1193627 RepID=UPI001F06CA6B|nr:hypothetical protein [Rheinheimera hassiensis]
MNNSQAATLILSLFAASLYAQDGPVFKGALIAQMPDVKSQMTDTPVAHVKDFSLTLNQDAHACRLTTDISLAKKGRDTQGRWVCLLEWGEETHSLTPKHLELSGLSNSSGNLSFAYTLSVFSGGQKMHLDSGSIPVGFLEPELPEILDYEVEWVRAENTHGVDHINYNRMDSASNLVVHAAPRPFNQRFFVDGKQCDINEGESRCQVRINREFATLNEKTGAFAYDGRLADTKNYWDIGTPGIANLHWDFREPSVAHIAMNSALKGEDLTVSHDGLDVTLQPDEAIAFIKTPHYGLDGNWWVPKNPKLNLALSNGLSHSNLMVVNNNSIRFNVTGVAYDKNFSLPSADPELRGEYLIYRYRMNELPDGLYDLSVAVSDDFDNSSSLTLNEQLLDRFAPDIKVLSDRYVIEKNGTEIYFVSDLTVAAHGGWDDGTEITKVLVNNEPVELRGDSPKIKVPVGLDYPVNSEIQMQVFASDRAGNEAVKNLTLSYMPVEFGMRNVPESLYQAVETTRLALRQTKGVKCKTASSPELAITQARGPYKGCTIEWLELPDGLESEVLPYTFSLMGGINELGDQKLAYRVKFYNEQGDSVTAYEGESVINVKPSSQPTFSLMSLNKLGEDVYGVPFNTNQITRYEIKTVPADTIMNVNTANGEMNASYEYAQRLRAGEYSIRSTLSRPRSAERIAWNETDYSIDVFHRRRPDAVSTEQFRLITLPDGGVRSRITLENKDATDADTLIAHVELGRYIRGSMTFDETSMGKWQTYLAYRKDGEYVPISDTVDVDSSGKAMIPADAGLVFKNTSQVYAISTTKGPYPEYQRTIASASARVAVIQSEAVEGILSSRTIEAPVPFSASMRFEFTTGEDRAASVPVTWERSNDMINWETIETNPGQRIYSERITVAGTTYFRVRMANKLTSEVSYSESLRVVGFETPKIRLEGPHTVYAGQPAQLTVFTREDIDIAEDGFTEWSIDNGATWTAGNDTEIFELSASTNVMVRYRLSTTSDVIGEEGYVSANYRVNVTDIVPVRIRASGPRQAEVGTSAELRGSALHANSRAEGTIVEQWVAPSGAVISGGDVSYTITEADIQDGEIGSFKFQAWVEGIKDGTINEATVDMTLWEYTLPEISLTLMSRVQIAPATIVARVDVPYFYAPGVELTYEWLLTEHVEVSRTSSSLTYLTAKNPGVHQIGIRVSDNRGNTREVFEFIDIVNADPMVAGMEIRPSNSYMRAPLAVSVRTNAKAGHPDDKIEAYKWFINGQPIEKETRPYATLQLEEAGDYDLTVEFLSKFGQLETLTERVSVTPNQPPICEPYFSEYSSSVTLFSNCSDVDGKIIGIKYQWRDDGYETSGGTQLRFTKSLHESLDVTIRATDDSGAETTSVVKWARN